MSTVLLSLTLLSLALTLWQFSAARRFPLHRRRRLSAPTFGVTVLKPLKGADSELEHCLRSWFTQVYNAPLQIIFAVDSADDPAGGIVRRLQAEFPNVDASLLVCREVIGANRKVSKLVQMEAHLRHDRLVISDADVWVPPDALANLIADLESPDTGLVSCLYRLRSPKTTALRWEAISLNADFWSQVLQSLDLKKMDFALGAAMALRKSDLERIGGFRVLVDYLADDYQLGQRIRALGRLVTLSSIVVDCHSPELGWREVWQHQFRWARTIRLCQPLPYVLSIVSNGTFWPLLAAGFIKTAPAAALAGFCLMVRILTALLNQARLTESKVAWRDAWLVPFKDLLNVAIWFSTFWGTHIVWRGERYRVRRAGRLEPSPLPPDL